MRNIKNLAFSVLSAALVTIGLFACSSDETNNKQENSYQNALNIQSKTETDYKIAEITTNNEAKFTINIERFKSLLISQKMFAEIESIEIDTDYLTIIGKDINDFSLVAFQAKLIKNGNNLYFPAITNPSPQTFFADTCAGTNCSSCSFIKNNGKITGCNCGAKIDTDKPGGCNHTTTQDGVWDKIKKWLDIIKNTLEILKRF